MKARSRNLLNAAIFSAMAFVATLPFAPAASAITIVPSCALDQSGKAATIDCALQTFTNIARLIFGLTGSFALLMFVVGGFFILSSAGNQEKVNKGKQYITNAVIGIFIILTAAYIVDYGASALQGKQNAQQCSGGTAGSSYIDKSGVLQQCCGQVAEANGVQTCVTTCPKYAGATGLPYACMSTKNSADTSSCVPGLCGGGPSQLCCLPEGYIIGGSEDPSANANSSPTNAAPTP